MRYVDCLVSLEKSPQSWTTIKRATFKLLSYNKADARLKMFCQIKSIKARQIPRMVESTLSTLMVSTVDFSKICLWKNREMLMSLNQTLYKLISQMKTLFSPLWFSIRDIISRRLELNYQSFLISQINYTPCKE